MSKTTGAILAFLLFINSFHNQVKAQEQKLSPGEILVEKSSNLSMLRQYDSALYYADKAVEFFQKQFDTEGSFSARYSRVIALLGVGQIDLAENEMIVLTAEQRNKPDTLNLRLLSKALDKLSTIKMNYHRDLAQAGKLASEGIDIREKLGLRDTQTAMQYENAGINFYYQRNADSCLHYFNKALVLKQEILDPFDTRIAETHRFISIVNAAIGNYDIQSYHTKKAIAILEKSGDKNELAALYTNMGTSYETRNDLDSALYYLELQKELYDQIFEETGVKHEGYASGLNSLANVYRFLGRYDEAEDYYEQVVALYKLELGEEHINVAGAYHNMAGYLSSERREFNKALEYYRESLRIRRQVLPKDHIDMAESLAGVGVVLSSLGENEEAIESIREAITIYQKQSRPAPEEAIAWSQLGVCYLQMEDFQKALPLFEKSLSMAMARGQKDNPRVMGMYASIIQTSLYLKDHERALQTLLAYEKALKEADFSKGITVSNFHEYKSKYFESLNELDSALFYAQKGIIALSEGFTSESLWQNPSVEQLINSNEVLSKLTDKAALLRKKYDENREQKYLEAALETLRFGQVVVDRILEEGLYSADYLRNSSDFSDVYRLYLENSFLLYQKDQASKILKDAFEASEKGRSTLLTIATNSRSVKKALQVENSLIHKENAIKARIANLTSKLSEAKSTGNDEAELNLIEQRLFAANREQEALEELLSVNYERYYQLKYGSRTIRVEEVQRTISKGTALIEFVEQDQDFYAFFVSKDRFQGLKLARPENFPEILADYSQALNEGDLQRYKSAANALYDLLLAPMQLGTEVEKLVIVPDGSLWNINFDLLVSCALGESFKSLDYLIKQYSVSYAYTANLLFTNNQNNLAEKPLIAFSFSDETTALETNTQTLRAAGDELAQLPGAAKEIRSLANILDGDYYFGKSASEANFKSNAPNYNILHLAIHGEIDDQDADHSRLFFSRHAQDSTEDNYLFPFELYGMDLNAQLVVLSACNTGTGSINQGEGIMSLGRAFQYAGAQSLVLSQWEIVDELTPKIIGQFYEQLLSGKSKDEALRQAKINFLNESDEITSQPYFWGGFVLLGNADPIDLSAKRPYIWYWVGLIFVILMMGLVRKRASKATT